MMNIWSPPGKNCGACGSQTCLDFVSRLEAGLTELDMCPFYSIEKTLEEKVSQEKILSLRNLAIEAKNITYSGVDVAGKEYDFVLLPFPDEPSARKFIVPFRSDLVEKWDIKKGDLVTGRPAGPGCPVYHALRVLSSNPVTGVIECHTVGPMVARKEDAHDIQAYHVHAFEGIASTVKKPPVFGTRQYFLPGNCMIGLAHTALVNMCFQKPSGLHVRLEDIRIL
ncbi:acetyl-CoA decarbonylase/synthase complex subunit gamma [Methanosarcina barkeri 3]|uniref:Acetyl-CoA decarbonylase/synthase complex subunit gamma n=2 Tax=Methanosarcina barkeri TaxID=2208 RepID=A0A0E3SG71_METBA|nr:acetyl-CoA decarbonylase/synthase complex subunit gamma [Methanosarcina barkeri 3]